MKQTVATERTDGVATITLDRPDAYNAVTPQLLDELNRAVADADAAGDVYAIVLTGAGGGFCAGMDFEVMSDWEPDDREYTAFLRSAQDVVRRLRTAGTPTVGAINGPAVGGGAGIALGCHVRFMHPDAFLRFNHARVGVVPVDGSGWLLPRLIGEHAALAYLLTGNDVTAADARDLGLAFDVVDDPLEAARTFAASLLDLPARATERTLSLVTTDCSFEEYCARAIDAQLACLDDPERVEAVASMREDRAPDYDRDLGSDDTPSAR